MLAKITASFFLMASDVSFVRIFIAERERERNNKVQPVHWNLNLQK